MIESEQSLEMQSEEEEEQEEEKPVTMSFMELRERIKVNPEMGAFLSMYAKGGVIWYENGVIVRQTQMIVEYF
mgnify:CR=1 FL=1